MKKILVIHNKYQTTGGEDIAVSNEISFLEDHYEIRVLYFDNNISNFFLQFFYFLFNSNFKSSKYLEEAILEFKPDIAYIHNTWFKASLSIFRVLKKHNIKIMLKLHNFRYDCTSSYLISSHLKANEICLACGLKKKKFLIFNKYFVDSYLKSLLVIRYGKKYINLIKDQTSIILVLTEYHKKYLMNLGFNKDKIYVFPNSLNVANFKNTVEHQKNLVYAGRISDEKGVRELILAFLKSNISDWKFLIIGTGPSLESLKLEFPEDAYSNINFLGEISNEKTLEIISNSSAVAMATKLLEGQPTLLCEASMLNKVSIFPNSGGILEFFPKNYPFAYKQFDYEDLLEKLNLLTNSELTLKQEEQNNLFISEYLGHNKQISKINDILNDNKI